MSSQGKAQRRSLKECLKTLLHRRPGDHGHLTKDSHAPLQSLNALTLLPSMKSLSTLSDFGVSEFDLRRNDILIERHQNDIGSGIRGVNDSQITIKPYLKSTSSLNGSSDIQDQYRFRSDISELAKICSVRTAHSMSSRYSIRSDLVRLNSVTSADTIASRSSLSQIITPDSIHFQSPLSQLAHAFDVPSMYQHGTSLQASLATITSLGRSTSALQLISPTHSHALPAACPTPRMPETSRFASAVKPRHTITIGKSNHELEQLSRVSFMGNSTDDHVSNSTFHDSARSRPESYGVNHFESFCVLDAAAIGYPVTATSDDLKQVIELGEPFVLNAANIDGTGMDIITGQNTKGEIVVHFIIYSPLVNPNNGRSRFVLASLLDITSFIVGSTDVPELEALSDNSVQDEEELRTPPSKQFQQQPSPRVSVENIVSDDLVLDTTFETEYEAQKDDVWLDLATEETQYSLSVESSGSSSSRSRRTSSSKSSVEDVLDQFLMTLQHLYSDFFLLGMSPLDETSFEIWNVSPSLHDNREYVDGFSAHMSNTEKVQFDRMLKRNNSFAMRIEWGATRSIKLLHCIPLFGRSNVTWICFLVEEGKWAELPTWR